MLGKHFTLHSKRNVYVYSISAILCITGTRCRSGQCTRRINFFSLLGANCHKHWTHTAPLCSLVFQYGAYLSLPALKNLCQFPHSYLRITFCCFNHLVLRFKRYYKSFCLPLLSLHNIHTDHSHIQQQQQLSLQLKTRTEERTLCM